MKGFDPSIRVAEERAALGPALDRLRVPPWVPGFAFEDARAFERHGYELLRRVLHTPLLLTSGTFATWVAQTFTYRLVKTAAPLRITAVIDREGPKGAIDGLLFQLLGRQAPIRLRAVERGSDGVTVLDEVSGGEHLLRGNAGIAIDAGGQRAEAKPKLFDEAEHLLDRTVANLREDRRLPVIATFKPEAEVVPVRSVVDLRLAVKSATETEVFMNATLGSFNRDPARQGQWYFRAGTEPGLATVEVCVVSSGGLSAAARCQVQVVAQPRR